ncbi:MAG TPA: FAD:protein FMN transferase [Firmicutes bacterium]|nr:FAD:protein FMN transferase [Candidatus Fermentithermobacillaceae bacterium]
MRLRKTLTWAAAGVLVVLALVLIVRGNLRTRTKHAKYTDSFFDTFDTVITVVAYTETEEEFRAAFERIHARFQELHKLYDIYNSYEGLNNVRTINENAGVQPVKVSREIIDLILFSKDWYARTGGRTNIAMGAVLRIWHDYRQAGMDDPESAELPPMERLQDASLHTDLSKVIVNEEEGTVYLEDPRMSLDVGAVAKGFATELVARELEQAGMESVLLSSGGNIRAIGKPLDGQRERWGIGIQDPDSSIFSDEEGLLDVVFVRDASVATSGGYQRFYVVDGKTFHHIIDPDTLMPSDYYRAVTVKTGHAGVADFLSTTLFLLPYERSSALAESLDGVDVLWVMPDGEIRVTQGMEKIMKSKGATGARAY